MHDLFWIWVALLELALVKPEIQKIFKISHHIKSSGIYEALNIDKK